MEGTGDAEKKEVFEIEGSECVHGVYHIRRLFPILFEDRRLDDTKLRSDDILIASCMRTGTTWLSQIISLMVADDGRLDEVAKVEITQRVAFMEMTKPFQEQADLLATFPKLPSPRLGKTHLRFDLVREWILRDGVKTVVPLRHPKDTLVSLFHFYFSARDAGIINFNGTWDDFFEHVKAGKTFMGSPVEWILSWWAQRDNTNIYFLKYEKLMAQPENEMRKLADFLGASLSEAKLQKILEASSFKSMQNDPAANYTQNALGLTNFIRKGKAGTWKEYFTVAQNEWFDGKYRAQIEAAGVDVAYD